MVGVRMVGVGVGVALRGALLIGRRLVALAVLVVLCLVLVLVEAAVALHVAVRRRWAPARPVAPRAGRTVVGGWRLRLLLRLKSDERNCR